MKYLVSFRTTLRISRNLFRALALLIWLLGAVLTTFYIISVLHDKENKVRQEFASNYGTIDWYVRHSAGMMRELKYIAENRLARPAPIGQSQADNLIQPQFMPLYSGDDCASMSTTWRNSLDSLGNYINYWKSNFASSYELNRVFLIGGDNRCLADFTVSNNNNNVSRDRSLKLLRENLQRYRNSPEEDQRNPAYWVSSSAQPGVGSFSVVMPVYVADKLQALLGVEQNIRLDEFIQPGSLPVTATITDENYTPLLTSRRGGVGFSLNELPDDKTWFGYLDGYRQLVLKKPLPPSELNVIWSVSTDVLVDQLRLMMINAVLLNIMSAVLLFTLAWLFERRMFLPAEENAHRLEEHEQFNRKIVASAPVGICILRTSDGTNILSNELAHNYLTLLTQEDRKRLNEIIGGQQVNFVDVLTGSNTNLQISFVHSRYRNENVAICVLVDVSARVRMEQSLQEMAHAAEQASQSKSMFLATVSHELRTPLYGIIGNLDLLQTRQLPSGIDSLVTAMNNSSSLLLKIISDILDFSKIESEQLKIEPRPFSPREVITHIVGNYLSLVVKKRLTLYCYIEHDVPQFLDGDPLRLQQVISNLLNNAIKFTHTGCIILHAYVTQGYLAFRMRDTGVGIPAKELTRLFDPFFQVGNGVQRNFQGTGLGLAICEKLINMMDGDIEVESEPGMGSQFIVRIPIYNGKQPSIPLLDGLQDKKIWLAMRNEYLAQYLDRLLKQHGFQVADMLANPGSDDVVLTDYAMETFPQVRAVITFDGAHVDMPREPQAGRWIHSTATLHELPTLLARIYRIAVETESTDALSLSGPVEEKIHNDDIMVLIVDDHPINRMLLSEQLGTLGYQVKTAQDGVDALNVLSRNTIDIVLTDVNMPNMDGYRLAQRLRQLGHVFPVIGVTANALAEEKQRCMDAGMDNCLSKPVTLDVLKSTLGIYAERVRKARQG
ncbi:two-component system sensor histidine kinase RcsC [Pantoea stewartii]|uniref:Sensor histidine kinase RcsC n=1 Tax=Pantoea stewartii subsp. stewartii DC283 TaxID=660596 RepID=H3REW7_PANSE|nr:two-component system sensor histidine kinase RcsC [Pantoea stewartii]ARF51968.1 two-component system sensor histidine kinase/response regulator [Pantoea stewartii subsp. stewartii DC283]EHT99809.1 hybrid sensory kinase in two-component regulatory system with RcsB and YojN [Pantoea stewartii subsp. stewartii DC283]KAB0560117.1 two-component system sensor histidine kinase RcsC [Pantoea stewartii subsp. stewartii]